MHAFMHTHMLRNIKMLSSKQRNMKFETDLEESEGVEYLLSLVVQALTRLVPDYQ